MATIGSQLNTLATNLQKVHRDGGQFIDAKGELVGAAVRDGFRGKIVKLLVDKGLAREGSLGGRIAVGLVGKESFDLLRTPTRELTKTSVANVLGLLEKLETEGLDTDLKRQVSNKITSTFSVNTPVRKLSARSFGDLHQALRNEIIPQRQAYRQGVLNTIGSGQATEGMEKASQTALLFAARALEEQGADPHATLRNLQSSVKVAESPAQGRGTVGNDAAAVLTEFKAALAQAGSERPQQDPGALEADLRQQFIDVIRQAHADKDVADGSHVRLDGSEGISVGENKESKVTIGGVEVEELSDVRPGDGDDWVGDFRNALDDAVESGDQEYVLNLCKELTDVIKNDASSAEDKRAAHELRLNQAFLGSFETVFEVAGKGSARQFKNIDAETKKLYLSHADQLMQVAQNTRDEMQKIADNPQSSPEFNENAEVLGKESAAEMIGKDARRAVGNASSVIRVIEFLKN